MRGAILLIATLAISLAPTECARILIVNPNLSRSHGVLFCAFGRELARRGHQVVMVSPYPLSRPEANYTDLDLMPSLAGLREHMVSNELYQMNGLYAFQLPLVLWSIGLGGMETTAKIPQVRALLEDKEGFDLVIIEMFANEALYGFAHHFKAPLVLMCGFGGFHWHNYGLANPIPASYVPNSFMDFSDHMTFPQRLFTSLFNALWDVGHHLYYMPRQEAIRMELFGDNKPSVWELERSVSLVLLNNHFSLNYPRPLVPAMVEVGGLHVSHEVKKLPEDLQKFLDGAKDGAIYFSMGSNLRSDLMPAERRQAFLEAFSELPQRVLWKWESDTMPGQPANVKMGKWLPQQDILAHPNVELFITHGGLLSAQEAAYHGVPLVGIPVFGDQGINMRKAELGGFGVKLDLNNVTKESVLWAIKQALQPSVRVEARRRSAVVRDQPQTPLDRAVFWTEYVIRHKGAPHLRSAALDLAWYQLYLLDVAAAILVTLLLLLLALRGVLRLCCGGAKKSAPAKQNKNKKKQ